MKKVWALNKAFFTGFGIFLLLATIALFTTGVGYWVVLLGQYRSPVFDFLFIYGTQLGEGVLFGLVALILIFYRYRYAIAVPLLGILVMLVSFISKSIFAHDRPLAYFIKLGLEDQLSLVEGVEVHSGATSFPSGHTMAGFALYSFMAFLLPKRIFWGLTCLLLALIVGLSRIYLVQHFLKDVYLGSIMGVLLAVVIFLWQEQWKKPWLERSLLNRK